MNITITKNLIKKISVMDHILSSIGKSDNNLINGILIKSSGLMQAANRTLNMSFKLTTEELGLAPDLPITDFILPEMAYRFLKNLAIGTSVDVSLISDKLIEIVVDGGKRKKNKVEFTTQPADEYPEILKADATSMQRLNAEWFKQAISKCSYAISDNNAKLIYTAAHLIARSGNIVAYAIDGFKAAVVSNRVDTAEKDFTLSIPQEVIKILGIIDFAETVIVGFNENHTKAIFVTDEATIIQGSLYTGNPIMYDSFVNKGKFTFTVDTNQLSSSIKQICVLNASKSAPMKITVKKDEIVCSYANEKTRFEDTVSIEKTTLLDEDVVIGLNPDALLNTLKNCSEDKTVFKFTSPLKPLEIYNADLSAIVVPMKVKEE